MFLTGSCLQVRRSGIRSLDEAVTMPTCQVPGIRGRYGFCLAPYREPEYDYDGTRIRIGKRVG